MNENCLIIAGGMPPSLELLQKEIATKPLLICADGGANCLFRYGILPNLIIGDGDSLDPRAFNFFSAKGVPCEFYPKDKSSTDAQLALKKAIELGTKKIVFLGCLGNRSDHVLGNLGLLLECHNLNIEACIRDDHNSIMLSNKSIRLFGESGEKFSLQAFGGRVHNLSITGSKFELENYELFPGDALTISNEFLNKEVNIEFTSGKLLIFMAIVNKMP